jgi:glycosyltransferase involved in cell wall biosynthesis
VILGIDGSNLRVGGGLRHLVEFLSHANPTEFGFYKVILWTGVDAANAVTVKADWLEVIVVKAFDSSLLARALWRYRYMRPRVEQECNVLFSPGGIALFTKVPEVTMCRNMQPFDKKEKAKTGLFTKERLRLELLKRLQTKSFKQAQKVIFLNQFAKDILSPLLNIVDGSIIPHGCNNIFQQLPKEQKIFNHETPIKLLYVSAFNSYKHQLEVISAFQQLVKDYPLVELTLAGGGDDGYYSNTLTKIKHAQQSGFKIIYPGKVSMNELVGFYHEADLFIFASSCENLPNILLEAMSSGLPIACSNVEPMPSVLKDGGIYFDPFSSTSIYQTIKKLISAPLLREKFSNTAFKESKKYNWQHCSNETLRVLSDAAKK